jgi:hypothetical protein
MTTTRSPRSGEICHVLARSASDETTRAGQSLRGVVEYYVRRTTRGRTQGWCVRFDRGDRQGGIWRQLVVISDDPAFAALEAAMGVPIDHVLG